MKLEPWQFEVQCRHCDDIIYSEYQGQFKTCKCGTIAVDQTHYYYRMIGNKSDYKILGEDEHTDNNPN